MVHVAGDSGFIAWTNSVDTQLAAASATYAPIRQSFKGAGIDTSGATSSSTALQAIVDSVRDLVRANPLTADNTIDWPAGTYRLTSTLIVPPYLKIRTLGTVKVLWAGTGAPAFWITPLAADPDPLVSGFLWQQENGGGEIIDARLGGIMTRNLNAKGTASVGIELGSRSDLGINRCLARYTIGHMAFQSFDTMIRHNTFNHYLGTMIKIHGEDNDVVFDIGDTGVANVNSGENFEYQDCVFANANIGVNANADAIDMNFIGCSFDFITTVLKVLRGYGRTYFSGGHIESVNAALGAGGGIAVSTSTDNAGYHVHFDGTVILAKSQTLFKGTSLIVSGTALMRPYASDTNPAYASSLICEDQVQATNFRNVQAAANGRRILTRRVNRISDPYWNKETAGAVATLLDWNLVSNSTLAITASSPESGGQALVITIPAGGYCEMTYKTGIPLRDLDERYGTMAFKQTVAGSALNMKLVFLDHAGNVIGTSGNVPSSDNGALGAGAFYLPNFLIELEKVSLGLLSRAATVKPAFTFSNPAATVVTVPMTYFGR